MLIQSWRGIGTLGALRQAIIEAEAALVGLDGAPDSETCYLEREYAPCNFELLLRAVRLTDGSHVYNLTIETQG